MYDNVKVCIQSGRQCGVLACEGLALQFPIFLVHNEYHTCILRPTGKLRQEDIRVSIPAQPRDTRDGACWQGQLKQQQEPGALGWQATVPAAGPFPLEHFPGKFRLRLRGTEGQGTHVW